MTGKLYIFDFDGVIVDSLEAFESCMFAACRECGLSQVRTRADFLKHFETNVYDGLRAAGIAPSEQPTWAGSAFSAMSMVGGYNQSGIGPGDLRSSAFAASSPSSSANRR
ncbi:MAG: HAD hydrolase-like protein [bacterium]